jgi:DNA-binding LytR/AlgR family response regulator
MSRKIIEEFIARTDQLNLIASYDNAMDAINSFNADSDIEMPEMSGIDFLESLQNPPQIIIISSKEKYALEAFNYDVTDYLLKPIVYSRFFKAINKANVRFKNKVDSKEDEIFIKKNSALVRLKYDDILWVEALENYVIFSTFNEKFTIHFTMKAIETKLPTNKFSRVHRSFIVNISKISMIEDNVIIVKTHDGNKSIPVGKSYKDKLLNDINLIAK